MLLYPLNHPPTHTYCCLAGWPPPHLPPSAPAPPRSTPQLPNLEEIWWVSAIGAATSLCYCTIALILGCVYAGNHYGSVGGLAGSSTADKVFQVLNALGSLGFAYSFAQVSV